MIIPLLLLLTGQIDFLATPFTKISYNGKSMDIYAWKQLFCGLGGASGILILGYEVFSIRKKFDALQSSNARLLGFIKNTFIKVLRADGFPYDNIDVRIFTPETQKQRVWSWINGKRPGGATIYTIKNIHPLADEGITNRLRYQVFPEAEGLVGLAYKNKNIEYEKDLQRPKNEIKFTTEQRDIAGKGFCLCVPIVTSDRVVAIVSMEHEEPIDFEDNKIKKWHPIMQNFALRMYDSVPNFFKGGNNNGNSN